MKVINVTAGAVANYTPDAMRAHINGTLLLHGIVDREGAEARQAFAQWHFRPASRLGEPVAIAVTMEMTFSLRSSP